MFNVVKVNDEIGNGVFATQGIEAEKIILKEKPIISAQFSWSKAYKYLACDYCLKPLETVVENVRRLTTDHTIDLPHLDFCPSKTNPSRIDSCSVCKTLYCSSQCRIESYELYHNLVCFESNPTKINPIEDLEEKWKMIHMPPETTTIILILRIICLFINSKKSDLSKEAVEALSIFKNEFSVNNTNYYHKLVGNKFEIEREIILECLKKAIKFILTEKLQINSEEDQISLLNETQAIKFLSHDGIYSVLSLLGRNQQGISTSPLSNWRMAVEKKLLSESTDTFDEFQSKIDGLYDQLEETVGQFLDSEGVGLYKIQHNFNHSCEPNCEIKFVDYNNILSVSTLRKINHGEELTISYLDECELECSTKRRRKYLLENYLFLCMCPKCQREPPIAGEKSSSDDEESHYDMDYD